MLPEMVIEIPAAAAFRDRLLMFGKTVKFTPLLALLDTVTTMFPEVAPLGTDTTIFVALQLLGAAVVPLNLTVLLP
ncbi:MAG TPA: hypothetical protein VFU50_16810 [Terriglobales bacterium]|nr:hypothetical protein [Terriglobales bacterium]